MDDLSVKIGFFLIDVGLIVIGFILGVKYMKWRILPYLNTEAIKRLRIKK